MTPIPAESMPWSWVKTGLEEVIRKTGATWKPRDVYVALRNKQAFLYSLGEENGFVIVQRLQDHAGPYLFVWVIYGDLAPWKEKVMQSLRDLAVSVGATRLEMRSPRKWEAAGLGWRPREVIYEADVYKE